MTSGSGFDRGDRFERLQSDLLRARKRVRQLEAELAGYRGDYHYGERADTLACDCSCHPGCDLERVTEKAERWAMSRDKEEAIWKARAEKAEAELAASEKRASEIRTGNLTLLKAWEDEKARAEELVRKYEIGPHNAHLQDDEIIRGCPECEAEVEAAGRESGT